MTKRLLDLAKEMNVPADELKRIAERAGIAIASTAAMLDEDTEDRLRRACRELGSTRGTVTQRRDVVSSGRVRTEQSEVEVRRRRRRVVSRPVGSSLSTGASPSAAAATAQAQGNRGTAQARSGSKLQESARSGARRKDSGPQRTIRTGGKSPAEIAATRVGRPTQKELQKEIRRARSSDRGGTGAKRRASAAEKEAVSIKASAQPKPGPVVSPAPSKKKEKKSGKPRLSEMERHARAVRKQILEEQQAMTEEEEERLARLAKPRKKKKKQEEQQSKPFVVRDVEITDPIIVSDLAQRMAVKVGEVVQKLVEMGMTVRANDAIDADTAELIVTEFGHRPKRINEAAVEDVLIDEPEDDESKLVPRPPVVVVVGHVDHGKTSLLDALRRTNVAAKEAGGITQHIGAYMVKLDNGDRVVFIDTPGHEAFTSLRARGAQVADVAVLVVAADDGVKPQTIEAIDHAKAAGVPIVVAVNKIDKPEANPQMVRNQLAEHGLVPEEWGGDTIFVDVSAKTGQGLDELLEMLALQTEILELKANPERRGRGVVIESRLDRGRGPVATVIVKNGTFHRGDVVICGTTMGRIRAIVDENGVQHRTAGPSVPFELLGLEEVPEAGEEVVVVENEKQAREIVEYRRRKRHEKELAAQKKLSMEDLFAKVQSGVEEVPVIVKGDVAGSVEALVAALEKLSTDQVRIKVLRKGVGRITESDISLASASNAIVLGFNVRPETKAKKLAETEGVDVRFYRVIYDVIDDMKKALAGKLAPEEVERAIGRAEVREIFRVPKVGTVAGCYVVDGVVRRDAKVRVLREGVVVYEGKVASLKRFKEDVREVRAGYECGLGIEGFQDIKVGDEIEFFVVEQVAATLD